MSIREVSRRTGLSRNTVRKYLTNGVVEPKYPARTAPKKLDAFTQKLEAWLKSEAKKGRKQRRTVRQIFNDSLYRTHPLQFFGIGGSCYAVEGVSQDG
jgi:transposase